MHIYLLPILVELCYIVYMLYLIRGIFTSKFFVGACMITQKKKHKLYYFSSHLPRVHGMFNDIRYNVMVTFSRESRDLMTKLLPTEPWRPRYGGAIHETTVN